MIDEKITITFNYQDFTFAQQIDENDKMILEINDKDGDVSKLEFETEAQIQKVIDNLYTQMRILKNAKERQNCNTKDTED